MTEDEERALELIKKFQSRGRERKIDSATNDERETLREEYESIVTVSGGHATQRRLHIPDDGDEIKPKCAEITGTVNIQHDRKNWLEKPKSQHPMGYSDWCKHCLQWWRDQ